MTSDVIDICVHPGWIMCCIEGPSTDALLPNEAAHTDTSFLNQEPDRMVPAWTDSVVTCWLDLTTVHIHPGWMLNVSGSNVIDIGVHPGWIMCMVVQWCICMGLEWSDILSTCEAVSVFLFNWASIWLWFSSSGVVWSDILSTCEVSIKDGYAACQWLLSMTVHSCPSWMDGTCYW
jgi:hypothetical protein